ncbi:MAG: 50S ribosomal protein L24 [Candidatus Bathyarchaeia archaeon]
MLSSSKPSKQRKAHFTAPLHRRYKSLAAPLSPELRVKYDMRSIPVRKGDTVTITRGDYAGLEGKIAKVDLKNFRITIEGVTGEKADGTSFLIPIHPSKVSVTKLNTEDRWRRLKLEERSRLAKEKPVEEKAEAAEEVEEEAIGEEQADTAEEEEGRKD